VTTIDIDAYLESEGKYFNPLYSSAHICIPSKRNGRSLRR